MSADEEEQALKILLESPQQIKAAIPQIAAQLGQKMRRDWVKRLLKKSNISGSESVNPFVPNAQKTMVNAPFRKRTKP
jgi:hypothetical protein